MRLQHLALTDFRCYEHVDVELSTGCTVIVGDNGQGKTSLLEAVDWLASGRSFRGAPDAALVRVGAGAAYVRTRVAGGGREATVEGELRVHGRNRVLVNRQPPTRRADVSDMLRVTVFSPDDLELVKGGPACRRAFLDDSAGVLWPAAASARAEVERVVRRRNALLRGGARDPEARTTLDVLDTRLAAAGAALVQSRLRLLTELEGFVQRAYRRLTDTSEGHGVSAHYEPGWAEGRLEGRAPSELEELLAGALAATRRRELERGVTLVGPHRDDWRLLLDGRDTRWQASQGEQRTVALALRLAGHEVVTSITGTEPVLLLDDVFSELDAHRTRALVANLPAGQTLLTTAGPLPPGVHAGLRLRAVGGRLEEIT